MSRFNVFVVSVVALVTCMGSHFSLGEEETKTTASKNVSGAWAKAIDFNASLGLPFDTLRTLGSRIDQARLTSDPVGVASAATELAACEVASGKKSELASDDLMKEAIELAKLRGNAYELKAVAALAKNDELSAELDTLVAAAKQREAEAAEAVKSEAQPRAIQGTLQVVNHTHRPAYIYVNGWQLGIVYPYSVWNVSVNQPWHATTTLVARSSIDNWTWGPHYVPGVTGFYRWTLLY